jgi:hypothetical protein
MSAAAELNASLNDQKSDAKPSEYVVCFSSPSHRLPINVLADFDGLYAIQEVVGKPHSFISYWKSAEHFERERKSFFETTNATKLLLAGTSGRLHLPKKLLIERFTWSTALLTAAAVLGAVEVVRNHYDRIFASPELAIDVANPPRNVVEGALLNVTATVENLHSVAAHRNLRFKAALMDGETERLALSSPEPELSSLLPTRVRSFTAEGTAPAAGSYKLVVEVSAEAGRLPPGKTFRTVSAVNVWSQKPVGELTLKRVRGTTGDFLAKVTVGPAAPLGLLCELTVKGVGELGFDADEWRSAATSRLGTFLTGGAGDTATARLRWEWGASDAYRTMSAELSLVGHDKTDWSAVARNAALMCTSIKESADVRR